MPPQQVVHEIADDQVWLSATLVHDSTRQHPGCAVPLDVDRSPATGSPTPELGPTRKTSRLPLEQDLEPINVELLVIRYRVAKTRAGCADHLDECLQFAVSRR